HLLPVTSIRSGTGQKIAPELYYLTVQIVNVLFVGIPGNGNWVLVDAGMPGSADTIIAAAKNIGAVRPPEAIVLTHGHFDHVGAVIELAQHWDVPIYAH